jgi:predicted nuclease of predicted toxin-antitoxin system
MKVYLDDNLAAQLLATLLQKAGHDVVRPVDVGLAGASDARHLEHAIRHGLVALTRDRDDFRELHQLVLTAGGTHPGLLVVRYDNDPTRDMKPRHIVSAIRNLEQAGYDLTNQLEILNHWR